MSSDDSPGCGGALPRALTALEREIVSAILTDECPAANELRAQLEVAQVSRRWPPLGSPSVDFDVPSAAPLAPVADGVLPISADVSNSDGCYIGELIVWVTGGRLSALEYAWVTDSMPRSLPPVEELVVRRHQSI